MARHWIFGFSILICFGQQQLAAQLLELDPIAQKSPAHAAASTPPIASRHLVPYVQAVPDTPSLPPSISAQLPPAAHWSEFERGIPITLHITDPLGQPVSGVDLALVTTAGILEPAREVAPGHYLTRLRQQNARAPRTILVAARDRLNPQRCWMGSIRVTGQVALTIKSVPNVALLFDVAGTLSRPFATNHEGTADIELDVGPGVTSVVAMGHDGVQPIREKFPLPKFSQPRLMFAPMSPVVADGVTVTPLRLLLVDEQGRPKEGVGLEFSAALGSVSLPRDLGNGNYSALYAAPRLSETRTDILTARIRDVDEPLSTTTSVRLLPVLPLASVPNYAAHHWPHSE